MKKKANPGEAAADRRSMPRLYVEAPLQAGASLDCTAAQANYLGNVLRLGIGETLLVFNGQDGEWLADITAMKRGVGVLTAREPVRPQSGGPDLHYVFAPLKKARLDYMVQKATEMGVAALRPVMTRRTNAERVNVDRMRANAVEAAEQCGILRLPEVYAPEKLGEVLRGWEAGRTLIFCDEAAPVASPLDALAAVSQGPLALLIGPEGGFEPAERDMLLRLPFVSAISLGPRVMRADTAAVAALALMNAVLGDWR
jgi:16S rRNA (uracil1498-N3)-methyltransferase